MPAVLLKYVCAAYINPLRQGRDRPGHGGHSLFLVSCCLSSIIICSSAAVCLLALSLSISILPLILHRSCLLVPCCTCATSFFQSPQPSIFSVCIYIYAVGRVPVLSRCLSGAIYQNEPSLCLSVFFFLCACESRDLVLLMDSLLNLTVLWPWSSDRNFRGPVCNKTVKGN